MVEFVCGGTFSTREQVMLGKIRAAAENGEDVLCIIPDQFSFEFDKKVYGFVGAKLFNSIKTAGFNRLSELLAKEYGGAGQSTDDHVRTVLMYKAVRSLAKSKTVRFYKRDLDKPVFISECKALIAELRESGVGPDMMSAAAERLGGALGGKLSDLSYIYSAYLNELEQREMTDSVSALSKACVQAREHGYFLGKTVFVDAFSGFTFDEYKLLEACISQCRSITVSLVIDEDCVRRYHAHPFYDTVRTRQRLSELADSHGKKTSTVVCDDAGSVSPELLFLSKNLYNYNKFVFNGEAGCVRTVSASDVFEEADFICSEIKRLMRESSHEYRDFAVVVRDMSQFASAMESAFERYEIPYFTDRGVSVETTSVVRYLIAVFKCLLTKEYSTDNIMKLIKSPLYPMEELEVNDLEQYCYIWDVDKSLWNSDFSAAGGLTEKQLARINMLRRSVIEPFDKFKAAIGAEPTAALISKALYDLFRDIKFTSQTYSVFHRANETDSENALEAARGFRQLWSSSLSAIKTIYDHVGDEPMSLRRYSDLFRVMLSGISVSKPPQKLDCVLLCQAGHSRTGFARTVFAAEVNDGVFPANVSSGDLITEHEKQLLEQTEGIYLGRSARAQFQMEKLTCYNALTLPTQNLYALYSQADLLGNSKRPSMLIAELEGMFGKGIHINASLLPVESFVANYRSAYYKYLETIASRDDVTETLRALLTLSEEYRERLAAHKDIHEDGHYSLPEKAADELFFNNGKLYISPTQLETYFKCPFSYFCKYGLSLRAPSKKTVGAANKGLLIHSMLEHLISDKSEKMGFGEAMLAMSDEELLQRVKEEVHAYIDEELGGDFAKPANFDHIVCQLEETSYEIALFVRDELGGSKFRPKLVEYKLNDAEKQFEIDAGNGKKLILGGTIDRADVYEDNGEMYVRVIDYKTGRKTSFKYSKLYHGLNLQMFVYLTGLLCSDGIFDKSNEHIRQAGVMYYIFGKPLKKKVVQSPDEEEDIELTKTKLLESFKPEGRTVDSENVLRAYNESSSYAYVPYKISKKTGIDEGGVTNAGFTALRTFAQNKIAQFGRDLSGGRISARPLDNTCTYCDYAGICGLINRDSAINTDDKVYDSLLREELSRIAKEGEHNE